MRTKFWIMIFIFAVQFWLGSKGNFSNAQTTDIEYLNLLERDKNVSQEKVDKAFAEAKKNQDDILAVIAEKKKDFKPYRTSAIHLKYTNPGRKGTTRNEINWRSKKKRLSIHISLGLNKEDELILFRRGLESISMGDFFPIPNIGDEAVLVKNVTANTKMTSVGFHFIKGRAIVAVYLDNYGRKTEKNEKELMEIVRLIEPLIVARPNFDD